MILVLNRRYRVKSHCTMTQAVTLLMTTSRHHFHYEETKHWDIFNKESDTKNNEGV